MIMEIWDGKYVPRERVEMEMALISSGLSGDIKNLLGRKFFFAAEVGSHHQELAGTIESIRTSDEGPLVLGVTNPTFWGERLLGLAFVGKQWCAYIDVKEVDERFIPGQIMLI